MYNNDAQKNPNMFAYWIILLVTFSGIQPVIFPGPTVRVAVQFIIFLIIAYIFILNYKMVVDFLLSVDYWLLVFFLYGFFVVINSVFVSDSYEQWRYLVTVFVPTLLLPIFSCIGFSVIYFAVVLRFLIKYTLIVSFIFFFRGEGGKHENLVYITYVSFLYFFIIMIPLVRGREKIIIVVMSLVSFFFDMTNRSNMLSIAASYAFLTIYYIINFVYGFEYKNKITIISHIKNILMVAPIVFLLLGACGIYNIFESAGEHGEVVVVRSADSGAISTVDSRTTIYEDALRNLNTKGHWLFGSSATVFYETGLTDSLEGYEDGRLGSSESGFLGFLTFGGIFYAIIVFMIFYKSATISIINSNSVFFKIFGLYMAFRWLFMFIENPLDFSMYWIFTFILIGATFNDALRSMDDRQLREYFNVVFRE